MNTKHLPNQSCVLCGQAALIEFPAFTELPRVTSDSRIFPAGGRLAVCEECGTIQKLADRHWLEETAAIYGSFEIYHQSSGAEQPIFSLDGMGRKSRSLHLIEHLAETTPMPAVGQALDFGCGNGAALKNFAERYPSWSLYGSELSDTILPSLRDVPGFVALYTRPLAQIDRRFDLIMMIHALEHVATPLQILRDIADRLEPGGRALIQVPNNAETPYDILIADHLTHFTIESLRFAIELAGYQTLVLSDALLPKELTFIGMPERATTLSAPRPDPRAGRELVERHLAAISSQMSDAKRLADHCASFGVFGTSISATWLSNVLGDKIAFYVDEDPDRIGRSHMGRPILAPADIPRDSDIFVPLVPRIAAAIAERIRFDGVRFHCPSAADGSSLGRSI